MLYTEDFSMHHYVGFLKIGSHINCLAFELSKLRFKEHIRHNIIHLKDF